MAGSLEADLLLDRRRLKRRLNLWRAAALVLLVGGVAAAVGVRGGLNALGKHVERVTVSGFITSDTKLAEAIRGLARNDNVAAIELVVDSPGGSVAGGESLHDALATAAAAKPVVTVMGGTAASAGYMISLPAARIFASSATLTGSIGVILETGNASGLLDKLGLSAEAITSGSLKDQPSFTRGLTPQGRDYLHGLVMDLYAQFVTMVAKARHLDEDAVRSLADGRAFTGRQALAAGLVDQIGGEPEARAWLARERGVAESLPVQDLRPGSLYQRTIGASLARMWPQAWDAAVPGLWAIWRPGEF